jgi:hypothetical protein
MDQKGGIYANRHFIEKSEAVSRFSDSNTSSNAGEIQKSKSALCIPDSIRDHIPVLYSIYLWYELAESLSSCGRK